MICSQHQAAGSLTSIRNVRALGTRVWFCASAVTALFDGACCACGVVVRFWFDVDFDFGWVLLFVVSYSYVYYFRKPQAQTRQTSNKNHPPSPLNGPNIRIAVWKSWHTPGFPGSRGFPGLRDLESPLQVYVEPENRTPGVHDRKRKEVPSRSLHAHVHMGRGLWTPCMSLIVSQR